MKKFLSFFVLAFILLNALGAQEMPAVPMDPAVRVGQLPNGLTYYIRHNGWPEKRVDFYIAQKVGSMQEEEDQRGLAHFLEHMCFNGTKNFPGNGLIQYLERNGVKFGADLNAYTSFDETVYNINNANVDITGIIDSCLYILHDWSHDLLLEGKEIDKERGVINEEWRMRRSAMMRMQEAAFRDLYKGSKYAERMPIGTMEVVMNFPHDAIRSYYRRWYRPDLQGIVVVGDVDVDQMEQKIKTVFADIDPVGADAPKREYFPVPDNEQPLISIQKDKEQTRSIGYLMFKTDPVPREVKGTMAYMVMNYVQNAISSMFNERISELIRQANPPFVAGYLDFDDYLVAKTKEAVNAVVVFKDGEYLSGLATMYREMLRAQRFGFTESEYARFQEEYKSQLEKAFNQRDKVKNQDYAQEYVRHFLDNEPAPGIEWEYEKMVKLIPMIPLQAINQTIAQLPQNNRAIAFFLPEKEGLQYPTEEEILQTLQGVDAENIEGYVEEVNTDPLVSNLTEGVQVKSIRDDVYGAKLVTLSNGIKIHVLQTDYEPNQIHMTATSWGGTSLYSNDEYLCSSNAELVQLGGWGQFNAIELQKKLAGIQASVNPSVSDNAESLSGQCVKKDLETMLQLTYLCFTQPHRDDDTFKSMMERYRSVLVNQDMDPKSALQDSVASILYGGNVRAQRLRSTDLDRFDYDRITQIYKERFANAGDFEFYFVGDLCVDSVAPLLAKYIGALPVVKGHEKYKKIDLRLTRGESTCIFDKEQDTPNALVNFFYHAPLKENLRNEILVSMLKQCLDMLFTETVREEEGGAYGVPVRATLNTYPQQNALVQIQLPTAPGKVERMTQVIYDGLDKLCNEGPSQDYLTKIREYMLRSHAEKLKNNQYWMGRLTDKTREGYEFVKGYDETVQKITAADIQKLARRIFRSGNRTVVGMKTPDGK